MQNQFLSIFSAYDKVIRSFYKLKARNACILNLLKETVVYHGTNMEVAGIFPGSSGESMVAHRVPYEIRSVLVTIFIDI